MHPYRIDNSSSLKLSFRDKLYFSNNPLKRFLFYVVSFIMAASLIVIGFSIIAVIFTILGAVAYGVYCLFAAYNWLILVVAILALVVIITSIATDSYRYNLERRLKKLNNHVGLEEDE